MWKSFPKDRGMRFTFFGMCNGWCHYGFRITAKEYERLLLDYSEAMSVAIKGKTHTEEAKTKIRLSSTGRFHSEETKARMRFVRNTPEVKNAISVAVRKRVEEGTHNFLGGNVQKKRVEEGTHNFLGGRYVRKMLEEGTHPFQSKKTCLYCGKEVDSGNHGKWHGDKCKQNPNKE